MLGRLLPVIPHLTQCASDFRKTAEVVEGNAFLLAKPCQPSLCKHDVGFGGRAAVRKAITEKDCQLPSFLGLAHRCTFVVSPVRVVQKFKSPAVTFDLNLIRKNSDPGEVVGPQKALDHLSHPTTQDGQRNAMPETPPRKNRETRIHSNVPLQENQYLF